VQMGYSGRKSFSLVQTGSYLKHRKLFETFIHFIVGSAWHYRGAIPGNFRSNSRDESECERPPSSLLRFKPGQVDLALLV
jgi:hypothetical protein